MQTILKLALWVLLLLPLCAQDPIIFGGKRSPARSGAQGIWMMQNPNLLLFSGDFTNATYWGYISYAATVNDATHLTFSAQYQNRSQTITVLDGIIYTVAAKIKRISGNYANIGFTIGGESGTGYRSYTITDSAIEYSATFYKTGGGSVAIGIQDRNVSGWGQVEVTNFRVNEGSTALPYVATTDGQSYPNLVSGGAALQRGSTSGADTSDPTRRGVGLSLDGVDDLVSNIPAAGSTYTKTFCSASECYTLDSAGNEYVNGVARTNRLKWTEDFSKSSWAVQNGATIANTTDVQAPDGTYTSGKIVFSTTSGTGALQSISGAATTDNYTAVSYVRTLSGSLSFIVLAQGTDGASCSITATTDWTPISCSKGTSSKSLYLIFRKLDTAGGTVYIWHPGYYAGSSSLPYQRTEGAAIPALGTSGGYTGLFAGLGQWSRILGAGEIIRDYFRWWRPQINSAGGTLP